MTTSGTALVFAGNTLDSPYAKTAHGLIRGSERFQVKGILDFSGSTTDAGVRLDGQARGITMVDSIQSFLKIHPEGVDYFVIGIASAGGKLERAWFPLIEEAISNGMSVVNGLHEFVSDMPKFKDLAEKHNCTLIDVRKPKPRLQQHFWEGKVDRISSKKIAVLGTDCAVGKRTTARMLMQEMVKQGGKAEMIYTGQTGWMQGFKYGFIFDSTLNDFVSGELEQAMWECFEQEKPEFMFLEGQASLRNPSGPCGVEFLISGKSDGVILVHPAGRTHFKGWEHLNRPLPTPEDEIRLIEGFGVPVLGLALNTKGITLEEAKSLQGKYEAQLRIPVCLPLEEGVSKLIKALR